MTEPTGAGQVRARFNQRRLKVKPIRLAFFFIIITSGIMESKIML